MLELKFPKVDEVPFKESVDFKLSKIIDRRAKLLTSGEDARSE